MYEVTYNAKKHAFTPRVIKWSFVTTGIYPFYPNVVIKLAKQNVGKEVKAEAFKYIQSMRHSVEHMLHSAKT